MPEGGASEAVLTADWNADGIERMRRYPRLRDRSIFVGNPGDLVDAPLGPGLPSVRDWTLERYTCSGYVTGFTPPEDREARRAELGYRPGERVCVVTVGGSGVGGHLLRRVASAFPLASKRVPGLRMIAVTRHGPLACWLSCFDCHSALKGGDSRRCDGVFPPGLIRLRAGPRRP
jgi:hypothetical protein